MRRVYKRLIGVDNRPALFSVFFYLSQKVGPCYNDVCSFHKNGAVGPALPPSESYLLQKCFHVCELSGEVDLLYLS